MDRTSPLILATGAFLGGATATYALTPLAAQLAHRLGAIDVPGGRRVHTQPTPRLGGVAIFLGLALGAATYGFAFGWSALANVLSADPLLAFLVPCLLIFAVGVVDDVRGLGPGPRLALEAIAATFLIQAGYVINDVTNPLGAPVDLGMFSYPFTMLWIVGVTNAFNLIDGLDGLLATVGAIILGCCGVVAAQSGRLGSASVAFALAGALVGFLPRNWHPAQIFMGDSGSLVVGFTVAAISLKAATTSQGTLSFHVAVALCALPLAETTLTLARRYVNGQPYFSGDRSHIHHVLVKKGLSVPKAVACLAGVTTLFCAVAVLSRYWRQGGAFAVITVLLASAGFGLRTLGYIELRVFGHRIRESMFRKRRRGLSRLLVMAQAGEALQAASTWEDLLSALRLTVDQCDLFSLRLESFVLPALQSQGKGDWILQGAGREPTEAPQLHVCVSLPLPTDTGRLGVLHCHHAAPTGTPIPPPTEIERYIAWPTAEALERLSLGSLTAKV